MLLQHDHVFHDISHYHISQRPLIFSFLHFFTYTMHWTKVGAMLGQRRRLWVRTTLWHLSFKDREVASSASDRQGSNSESYMYVWTAVSSHSPHHPREVVLAQFSLYVHKGGLDPPFNSFYFDSEWNQNSWRYSEGMELWRGHFNKINCNWKYLFSAHQMIWCTPNNDLMSAIWFGAH